MNGSLASIEMRGNNLDGRRFRQFVEGLSASLASLKREIEAKMEETGVSRLLPRTSAVFWKEEEEGEEGVGGGGKEEKTSIDISHESSDSSPTSILSKIGVRALESLDVSANPIGAAGVASFRSYLHEFSRALPLFSLKKIVLEDCGLTSAEVSLHCELREILAFSLCTLLGHLAVFCLKCNCLFVFVSLFLSLRSPFSHLLSPF